MNTGCPWDGWARMPAQFCEESLCAWVRQPGNTWSNVGFLVAGAWIAWATRAPADRHLRPMAWIVMAMGIGSGFFHASETTIGALGDYATMYLGTAFMALVVLRRLGVGSVAGVLTFVALIVLGTASVFLGGSIERWLFAAVNLVCPIGEAILFARPSTRARSYRWFFAAYAAFIPAMVLWYLDERRILCDPENHFASGHAAWHLLDAAMFGFSFLYYRQFEVLRGLFPAAGTPERSRRGP